MAGQWCMTALDCSGQVSLIYIYTFNNNSASDVHNEVTNECIWNIDCIME